MKRTLPMTDEEIARSYRLAAEPAAQIRVLAELNATSQDVIRGILARRGVLSGTAAPSGGRKRLDLRMKERLELYNQGLNDCEIARRTGYDRKSVRDWRSRNGLPANCGRGRKRSDTE